MTRDVKTFVKTCDKCQRVNDKFTKPSAQLHPIPVEPALQKQIGCFNHRVVTPVADKLWL